MYVILIKYLYLSLMSSYKKTKSPAQTNTKIVTMSLYKQKKAPRTPKAHNSVKFLPIVSNSCKLAHSNSSHKLDTSLLTPGAFRPSPLKFQPISPDTNVLKDATKNKVELEESLKTTKDPPMIALATPEADSKLLSLLKQQINESSKAREDMQEMVAQTKKEFKNTMQGILKEREQQLSEISKLKFTLGEKDSIISKQTIEIDNFKTQANVKQVETNLPKIILLANQSQFVDGLNEEITKLKKEKEGLFVSYNSNIKAFDEERVVYLQSTQKFTDKIKELNALLGNANTKIQNQEAEIGMLNERVKVLEKTAKSQDEKLEAANTKATSFERANQLCAEYVEKIAKLMQDFSSLSTTVTTMLDQLKVKLNDANEKIKEQSIKIAQLNESLSNEQSINMQLKASIENAESLLHQNKLIIEKLRDEIKEVQEIKRRIDQVNVSNETLRTDINKVTSEYNNLNTDFTKIKEGSEKVTKDNSALIDLYNNVVDENSKVNKQVNDLYDEAESLKSKLDFIKKRVAELHRYIPIYDDPIDVALAEYLNSKYEEGIPVQIPFSRQSKGIYTFGSVKVLLKLESDFLIVRLGGGYSKITDFIETQEPVEIERLKKNGIYFGDILKIDEERDTQSALDKPSTEECLSIPNSEKDSEEKKE